GSGDEDGWVAGASWTDPVRDLVTDRSFGRRNDLADRKTTTVAKVADQRFFRAPIAWGGRLDRPQVRVGQIGDVDVVPDARAVGGRIVVAEDRQLGPAAGGAQDGRDQVRLRIVILAELVRGARDVEIAKG